MIVGASLYEGTVVTAPPELGEVLEVESASADWLAAGEFGEVLTVFEIGVEEPVDSAIVVVEAAMSPAATATLPFAVLIRTVSEVGTDDSLPSPPQLATKPASSRPQMSARWPVLRIDIMPPLEIP